MPRTRMPPDGDFTEHQLQSPRLAGQAEPCAYAPGSVQSLAMPPGRSIPRNVRGQIPCRPNCLHIPNAFHKEF
jgi:hypothetical protein